MQAKKKQKYYCVRVVKSGYAIVPATSEEAAREAIMSLEENDFDWSENAGSAELVGECSPTGETIRRMKPHKEQAAKDNAREDEFDFLYEKENAFAIYQLRSNSTKTSSLLFRGSSSWKMQGAHIMRKYYDFIYSGPIPAYSSVEELLEKIYVHFNCHIPDGFKGRSLSVSDVVVLKLNDGRRAAYFVDSIGFTAAPNFFRKKTKKEEL